jgi:hypothetical protein
MVGYSKRSQLLAAPLGGRLAERVGWPEASDLVNNNTPSPPSFSQVFILKKVKVICFDTLLQVFILNNLEGREKCKSQSP